MKPWLDLYPVGDLQGLLDLEDEYRIDSLVVSLEQRIGLKNELTDEEDLILSICEFDRQINNGGFDQYLNFHRQYAHRLVSDLQRIGWRVGSERVAELYRSIELSTQPTENWISALVDTDKWSENEDIQGKLDQFDSFYFKNISSCDDLFWVWLKANKSTVTI